MAHSGRRKIVLHRAAGLRFARAVSLLFLVLAGSVFAASPPLQPLRVVTDNNYPPYVFLGSRGELQGILVDQWRLWQEKTGIPVEIVGMDWESAQKSMRAGEFDVIDTTFKTTERLAWLDFGKPYTRIEVPAFFKNQISGITNLQSLRGFVVAVKEGDAAVDLLRRHGVEQLVFYKGYEDIIRAAKEHKVNVFVIDKPPALYFLYKYGIERQFNQSEPFTVGEFHRAVTKGNTPLLQQIESGFARISKEELQAVEKKWYGAPLLTSSAVGYLLVGTGVLWVILLLFLYWNRSLRRAVKNRTADLESSREALQESESRYRGIIENIEDIFYRTDAKGDLVFISPSGVRLLGYDCAEEMIGRPNESFWLSPEKRSDMLEVLRRDGIVRDYEVVLVRRDGSPLEVATTSGYYHDKQGQVLGVEGIFRDITERKRAEEELRVSRQRLRLFLDASPDMYFLKDTALRYILVNEAITRFFGCRENDIIGRTDAELMPGAAAEQCRASDMQAMQAEGTCVSLEEVGDRIYEALKLPLLVEGKVYGVAGIIRDITERERESREKKKLQSQLLQSQKMESVGRLAGGVAHDFNNMLSVILGHAELAMGKMDATQPLFANLQEISRAATRSAELTRQLLAFARKQTVAPKILDVNETVAGMLNMLRRLIGEDIDLAWYPGKDVSTVSIDPSQIDQMLANLCINARDAIADTGRVTIETSSVSFTEEQCRRMDCQAGEYVLLAVSDDGCGMDADTLSHLFEPFFTTKEMGKGTGLGLATVYGIVKQNNGVVQVSSEQGQGSTFKIYLPKASSEQAQKPPGGVAEPVRPGRETILLVEDEPMILDVTATMLQHQGYTVLTAASPGEAMRLAREHAGDISMLLTDVVMPEMNGRDLAMDLLQLYPGLKRLFMSGYTANVIAHHGVLDEGVHFIQKPFAMQELFAKVREVLDA